MSDDPEQLARVAAMRKQLKEFRMIGSGGVTVHGDMQKGYAIGIDGGEGGGGGGGGGDVPGCIDPAADNYNPAATVDDGSCIYSSCPELTLLCDSVRAEKAKCGFWIRDGSQYYLGIECDGSFSSPTAPGRWSSINEPCCCECSPADIAFDPACGGPDIENWDFSSCVNTEGTFHCPPFGGGRTCDPGSVSGSSFFLTGGEYLTSDLIARTEAVLPSYLGAFDCGAATSCCFYLGSCHTGACVNPDGFDDKTLLEQGCACSAHYNLSSDELIFDIQRFQYKWIFSATPVAFTITWNEHTLFDDMTTSDNPMTTSVSTGATETSVFECLAPTANGTTTITDIVCVLD